ncbi:AAA domain-containing protein [Xylaria bambusicola]|uniref:AAA domain-containing protein n=1 Tax=Xylaria bambusicola TaxID=326684 RepID=UPI0020083F8D|nr:AAA domain-containing protein [Xylaria bambusicola]KAI0506904.1 AAA domain-containing protein [Xylaria bambusicola]
MSKIDKLSIIGIRSFGHVDRQNIAFFTPLTLIVGYNGSGKTTIIECLKYATTGELPPNSKGGAFIHDPKLAGEREVSAQVKLRYDVPPNTSYVVTRSLQLTMKKTARTQKTLDATLASNCDGEKSSVSSKEANLNKLISDTLGVSPAILDAVIFCHQEESLWPMSEPAALKKRFDEIFEAMKYTKAIENLKVLRKKQGETLARLKTKEIGDKQNKDKAEKCEVRCRELEAEIEALRTEAEGLHVQVEEAAKKAKERRESANSYLGIHNELQMKKEELRLRTISLEESRGRMDQELSESDSWLQDALSKYEEHVARYEQDIEENISQYKEYKDSLDEYRQQHSEKLAERGRHESDKAKYERQLKSRIHLVQQAAQLHSIRGFDGDLDDQKVQSFYDRIQRLLVEKKQELDRLQAQNASETDNQTAAITELEGQKSRHTQDRVFAKQRITACEKSIAALQRDLNAVEIDEGAKAILESESKDLESRFQQASQDLQNADFDRKLQQEELHLQQLEGESSRLGRELVESTRLLSDRAQLEVRKEELMEKNRRLVTLQSTWNEKLTSLLGGAWDPATVEKEFHKGLQVKNQALDEASRKRDDTLQQLKTVQTNLTSIKERNRKRDTESTRCKNIVVGALKNVDPDADLGVDALPTEIERLESDIVTLKNDLSLSTEMSKYYASCRKTMNEKNKCELCERPFANANDKSRLAAKIRSVLEQFGKTELEVELKESEQLLSQLRAARPQSETYIRLLAEKKESEKELQDVLNKEASTLRILEGMDDTVRAKQEERQDFESMSKTVLNISHTHKDIMEAEAQVDRITSQQQSSGTIRTTQEITELQTECGEKLKVVKNKITKLSNEKQRLRDTVNMLELERSELRNKLSDAVRQLERKTGYQTQIQGQKTDIAKQREIIQDADKDLESVEPEISKARAIRDDILQRGRNKEKKVAGERDGLAGSVSELKMIDIDIQDYLRRGGPSNLNLNEQAIQALERTIKRTDEDMVALVARANKMKEDMASSDKKKNNIKENLTHRKAARDVDTLQGKVVELESRRAEEDYERLKAEAERFDSVSHMKNAERGAVMGAMKSKDEELVKLLREWDLEYENAAQTYRETHIKVETTKAAIEDLGRYSTALNNAIMQYHAMKMEEVNRIAGELWQSTYQGTDIDTILIRSDSEATNGRSSYNYRVCMVKQDTEMDMRGRCSAGQKVLASIIIRLALAESFGIGCGLIALDEPTTNLDRDNIKSLAESLHSIIKARRVQRNFQLIVITHDEDFLRHMRCSEFCDDFWRVSRDEKQNSRIERESIATIV